METRRRTLNETLFALGAALVLLATMGAKPAPPAKTEEPEKPRALDPKTFKGLELRGIGPALTSGRIGDLAVDPRNRKVYYAAAASGGVWKTINAGTTWEPVFDGEGSYSIGTVVIDPHDPDVVWVGTGENNSQRSVGYGDGVYKSLDGGQSWTKMGLDASEHVARIVLDPRDPDTVYVAAQGPLWGPGGDRGLYKSSDGGKTWKLLALPLSENTGVTDLVFDPRDPDVLIAAAYQRRRHVWTLINGGPESALYKSTDGGATWRKLDKGLPKDDLGRIGLAVAPSVPDVVYAIIEAVDKKEQAGVYRSRDFGESWERRSPYLSSSPQYYQELVVDPTDADRVYSLDTWLHVSEDGGKTFVKVGEAAKHVDNHALWIDPADPAYLLAGCDGGVYESFDRGATWSFKANLPITQFYKITVDDAVPFYNVYGGTQDNFTLGGPVRTRTKHGITNDDWSVVVGGDGFQPQVEPGNPDVVYGQAQHGALVRFDRKSGQTHDIQPQPAPGEAPLRWNWDSPLLISPHSPTRLYFAAQRLFRSDDRGDGWRAVSADLTRQLDRNLLPVMGKVWSVDTVAKNNSTSFYGNLVALDESPLAEGLLYTGSDDGLIHVSADGGGTWQRLERFPGVPDNTYVNELVASRHAADTVYAAFNNHKRADFKPYLLVSRDRGRTWTSVAGDLPARGSVYTLAEDHVDPALLFAGTEFGVFFTRNGGQNWVQLEGGMPTIAVRDLAIQRRENDLVVGTFGRGFYVLDDYSPLRSTDAAALETEALLFPPRQAWMYVPAVPLGLPGKSFLGDAYYTAPNPPFGAVFTYYLKDELKTLREQRLDQEEETEKAGGKIAYPAWEKLRAEDLEPEPKILLTVTDETGTVVRRLEGPTEAGFHRVAWDLRYPAPDPTSLEAPDTSDPFVSQPRGAAAPPGRYQVSLAKKVGEVVTTLGEPKSFEAVAIGTAALPVADLQEITRFQQATARLQRAVLGAISAADEAQERLDLAQKALLDTPGADLALLARAEGLEKELKILRVELEGDTTIARRNEPTPPSISDRVSAVIEGHWSSTSAPTTTQRDAYRWAGEAFTRVLAALTTLIETELANLETELEKAGAPWTPGRVPRWVMER